MRRPDLPPAFNESAQYRLIQYEGMIHGVAVGEPVHRIIASPDLYGNIKEHFRSKRTDKPNVMGLGTLSGIDLVRSPYYPFPSSNVEQDIEQKHE